MVCRVTGSNGSVGNIDGYVLFCNGWRTVIRLNLNSVMEKIQIEERYMSKYVGIFVLSRIILPDIYDGFSAYWFRWECRSFCWLSCMVNDKTQ